MFHCMIPELQQLGFTRNEASVYATALKLGSASVQQLASATGLNRITVHSIVEKFERMKIFSHRLQGKRRRIHPVDPKRLEELLATQERVLNEKQESLGSIMPMLQEMFRRSERGLRVRTFEGAKGYEQMCEDVLETNQPMLEYANIEALRNVIDPYIASDYLPRKHKLQIPSKFLYVDSPAAREYVQQQYLDVPNASPVEAKFIDPTEFEMDAFFVIYGNKLSILTFSTMEGVIIEDAGTAAALKPFFHFVWHRAGDVLTNT